MTGWFRRLAPALLGVAVLAGACANPPRYSKGGHGFHEWASYDRENPDPVNGVLVATDPAAGTVTIRRGNTPLVFAMTPDTRLLHDLDTVTLAQLPLNHAVKYRLSGDGRSLVSIWYSDRAPTAAHAPAAHHDQFGFY